MMNTAIYSEIGKGIFLPATKRRFLSANNELVKQGAEGIIFVRTETPISIKLEDCTEPVFDTAKIHLAAAAEFALDNKYILAHNYIWFV